MDVLEEIQLSISHLNSRLNSMDERLDSLGAQVAAIDLKVSLGVSAEELHADPAPLRSSEATQSPPYAKTLHLICICISLISFYCLNPLLASF